MEGLSFGGGFLLGALAGTLTVGSIVWLVFRLVAGWRVFTKMGVAGWKSLIPYYREYVLYGKVWAAKHSATYLVAFTLGTYITNRGTESLILNLLAFALVIVALVVQIKCYCHLSRSFGHGTGFAVGLVLLEPIFTLILAFGQSTYLGNLSGAAAPAKE